MTSKVGTILGSTTSLAPIYLVYHLIKSEISAVVSKPVVAAAPKEKETNSEQKTEVEEKQEQDHEKQEESKEKVSNETITKVTLEVVSKALSVISVIGSK